MIKHLAAPVLGLAVLVGAAAPAIAERGKTYVVKPAIQSSQADRSTKYNRPAKSHKKRKFEPNHDFETEAVWRNLRPSWFD